MIAVGNEYLVYWFVGHEGDHQISRDPGAIGVPGFRRIQPEDTRHVWGVMLPPAPSNSVALAHQEAIACLQRNIRRQVRGVIEIAQARPPAAVENVKEQPAVSLVLVHGLQNPEVGVEVDLSGVAARRQAQVRDRFIEGVHRINGEINRAV